jgi:hypothetical protein
VEFPVSGGFLEPENEQEPTMNDRYGIWIDLLGLVFAVCVVCIPLGILKLVEVCVSLASK